MSNVTHAEFVQGLRELASFYELHPELELPGTRTLSIYLFGYSVEEKIEMRDKAITTARAFGTASKDYASDYFFLRKEFSGDVKLEMVMNRDTVCEPVVVGYTDEPEQVIPERIVPARRVPKIEWQCGKSLLAAAPALGAGAPALNRPVEVELEEGLLLESSPDSVVASGGDDDISF